MYKKIICNTIKKNFYIFMLFLNTLSFILGILYELIGTDNLVWNIFGFLMLTSFGLNIYMAYLDCNCKRSSYVYLVLAPVIMILLIIMNYLSSSNPVNQTSQSIVTKMMIYFLFILGGLIAGFNSLVKQSNKKETYILNPQRSLRIKKIIRITVIVLLCIFHMTGIWIAYKILKPHKGISLIAVSHLSLFYAFIFLSTGFLIRKILKTMKLKIINILVLFSTIIITFACFIPFLTLPIQLHNADKNYSTAFGEYYKMNPIFHSKYYKQLRFMVPEYFYGTKSNEYQVQENILFYEGKGSKEKGLKLYFDVYTPPTNAETLPGGNSVLIRIHGGGWVFGDKGIMNFAQMNKYFASQGYIVFDIQYGFSKFNPLYNPFIMSDIRYGDYTTDDMVRHIGEFTSYLAEHSEEYNANIHSVFISGGSAGGNLALATGLGLTSEKYTDIIDSRIRVKGFIPFYPANEIPILLGIGNTDEFINPGLLVDKDTPPCLIFQGTHDGIVDYSISDRFKDSYLESGNEKCAIIYMTFGEHGCDMYFSGYYNQIFLYYMERFMYQYK